MDIRREPEGEGARAERVALAHLEGARWFYGSRAEWGELSDLPCKIPLKGTTMLSMLWNTPSPICWFTTMIIRRRQWQPTPVLLPGKSHERRSLVGCSPWSLEESDRTEQLRFHFSFSCIGEGNGNHSSILAQRIPGTREPGGLLSIGLHRVRHDWSNLAAAAQSFSILIAY